MFVSQSSFCCFYGSSDYSVGIVYDKPAAAAAAKSLQSCLTLCDPTDGDLPGSSIHGILQARVLEWIAIAFSNTWKWKRKWSRSVMSDSSQPRGLQPTRLLHPWDFPGKSTGVGCHCLLHSLSLTDPNWFEEQLWYDTHTVIEHLTGLFKGLYTPSSKTDLTLLILDSYKKKKLPLGKANTLGRCPL